MSSWQVPEMLMGINVKKTFQFKTQCKGVKSHIQNCTNHFGEDTWSNPQAALTYLGHVTPFYSLDPHFY